MRRIFWPAALLAGIDQIVKALARRMTEPRTVLPGVLRLRCIENTGIAFGLFSDMPWLTPALTVAVLAAGWFALRGRRLSGWSRAAAAMILGGAAGNLIDRMLFGRVTDMIEVLFINFPVFNFADICVTAGCVLMGALLLFRPQDWSA